MARVQLPTQNAIPAVTARRRRTWQDKNQLAPRHPRTSPRLQRRSANRGSETEENERRLRSRRAVFSSRGAIASGVTSRRGDARASCGDDDLNGGVGEPLGDFARRWRSCRRARERAGDGLVSVALGAGGEQVAPDLSSPAVRVSEMVRMATAKAVKGRLWSRWPPPGGVSPFCSILSLAPTDTLVA